MSFILLLVFVPVVLAAEILTDGRLNRVSLTQGTSRVTRLLSWPVDPNLRVTSTSQTSLTLGWNIPIQTEDNSKVLYSLQQNGNTIYTGLNNFFTVHLDEIPPLSERSLKGKQLHPNMLCHRFAVSAYLPAPISQWTKFAPNESFPFFASTNSRGQHAKSIIEKNAKLRNTKLKDILEKIYTTASSGQLQTSSSSTCELDTFVNFLLGQSHSGNSFTLVAELDQGMLGADDIQKLNCPILQNCAGASTTSEQNDLLGVKSSTQFQYRKSNGYFEKWEITLHSLNAVPGLVYRSLENEKPTPPGTISLYNGEKIDEVEKWVTWLNIASFPTIPLYSSRQASVQLTLVTSESPQTPTSFDTATPKGSTSNGTVLVLKKGSAMAAWIRTYLNTLIELNQLPHFIQTVEFFHCSGNSLPHSLMKADDDSLNVKADIQPMAMISKVSPIRFAPVKQLYGCQSRQQSHASETNWLGIIEESSGLTSTLRDWIVGKPKNPLLNERYARFIRSLLFQILHPIAVANHAFGFVHGNLFMGSNAILLKYFPSKMRETVVKTTWCYHLNTNNITLHEHRINSSGYQSEGSVGSKTFQVSDTTAAFISCETRYRQGGFNQQHHIEQNDPDQQKQNDPAHETKVVSDGHSKTTNGGSPSTNEHHYCLKAKDTDRLRIKLRGFESSVLSLQQLETWSKGRGIFTNRVRFTPDSVSVWSDFEAIGMIANTLKIRLLSGCSSVDKSIESLSLCKDLDKFINYLTQTSKKDQAERYRIEMNPTLVLQNEYFRPLSKLYFDSVVNVAPENVNNYVYFV
eukprot:g760.t1